MPLLNYLFDLLCGWAAPVVRALSGRGRNRCPPASSPAPAPAGWIPNSLTSAGPRTGASRDRPDSLAPRPIPARHWATALGNGATFDSGPANAPLTAVHHIAPEREVEALYANQQPRFVGGRDIRARPVLAGILAELGPASAARRLLGQDAGLDAETQARTCRGIALMRGETPQLLPDHVFFKARSDLLAGLEAA